MPDQATTDNRREIHLRGETAAVLFIRQERDRQGQPTSGEHGHQPTVTERTDEPIERHRREVIKHRTQLQAQAVMGGQEGIASDLRAPLAIAQDEVGEHGEYRAARRTLETPDGEPTQADPDVMRVARQASAPVTGRLVGEWKAEGQEKGEDAFDKRLAITKQLIVGGFILEIDRNGTIFTCPIGGFGHGSPQVMRSQSLMGYHAGNILKLQAYCERLRALPRN